MNSEMVNVGDTVLFGVEVDGQVIARPGLVTCVYSDVTSAPSVDIVLFTGNGVNDLKYIPVADDLTVNQVTVYSK